MTGRMSPHGKGHQPASPAIFPSCETTAHPPVDRRYGSKIDPYAHLVDGWLESDRLMPRKQRHTARRIHDRLLSETDYAGEYSTTQRYVRRWRQANQAPSDGYCELDGLATVCWTVP